MLKPKIVCLCGSTRFKDDFLAIQKEETLKGHIVLSVGMFGHLEGLDMNGPTKAKLDILHLAKIDLADEVIIINKDFYIGESTRREIEYATMRGKAIKYIQCNHLNIKEKYCVENKLGNKHAVTHVICTDCGIRVK